MIQISQFAAADALNTSMIEAIFAAKAEKPNLWAQIRSYPSSGRFCFNLGQMSDELPVIKSILNKIHQSSLWIERYCFNFAPKNLISQAQNLACNMLRVNGVAAKTIEFKLRPLDVRNIRNAFGQVDLNDFDSAAAQC